MQIGPGLGHGVVAEVFLGAVEIAPDDLLAQLERLLVAAHPVLPEQPAGFFELAGPQGLADLSQRQPGGAEHSSVVRGPWSVVKSEVRSRSVSVSRFRARSNL